MDVHEADTERQGGVAIQMQAHQAGGRSWLVFVQGLLIALSLIISFHNLWTVQSVAWKMNEQAWKMNEQGGDTGIYLELIGEARNKDKLNLGVYWKQRMEYEGNSTIFFQCSGPYLVHLSVCLEHTDDPNRNATLILQQNGADLVTFPLSSQSDCNDQRTRHKNQTVLNFSKNDRVSLSFTSQSPKIVFLHLRFHYMFGEQCFPN